MQDFILYLKLGWEHIISLDALDHQLFVLVLVAAYSYSEWRKILILVTAFTIGHSITLALSTLDVIRISSDWVEFLIPLTILITAFDNILMRNQPKNLMQLNYYLALILLIEFLLIKFFKLKKVNWMVFASFITLLISLKICIERFPF